MSKLGKLTTAAGGGLAILGVANDSHSGEPVPQAIVPVLGTAAGALVGAAVGIFASGAVDSMWENGVDGLDDVGAAISDGLTEVGETGLAIGDLAEDVAGGTSDLALFFLSYVIEVAIGTCHRGYVALNPEGVHHLGWSSESFIPWSAVAGSFTTRRSRLVLHIVAFPEDAFRWRRTSLLWRLDEKPDHAEMAIDLVYLGVAPKELEAIINHFVKHPTAQASLNTESGLEQVRYFSISR